MVHLFSQQWKDALGATMIFRSTTSKRKTASRSWSRQALTRSVSPGNTGLAKRTSNALKRPASHSQNYSTTARPAYNMVSRLVQLCRLTRGGSAIRALWSNGPHTGSQLNRSGEVSSGVKALRIAGKALSANDSTVQPLRLMAVLTGRG